MYQGCLFRECLPGRGIAEWPPEQPDEKCATKWQPASISRAHGQEMLGRTGNCEHFGSTGSPFGAQQVRAHWMLLALP